MPTGLEQPNPPAQRKRIAFTLVELLVVIAIIAILAAMLLPVLGKAKLKGQGIQCMNNHRQLALAWRMYADDNGDQITFASEDPTNPPTYAEAWISGTLDFNANNPTNWNPDLSIKQSPLWPYCGKNLAIWKCPADTSAVTVNGKRLPRVRSMSMNVFLGGWGGTYGNWDHYLGAVYSDFKIYRKVSQITADGPDKIFVFLDMREDSVDMGNFATSMRGYRTAPSTFEFFDLPGNYHHYACGFSFSDGHAEIRKWTDRRTTPPLVKDRYVTDTFTSPHNEDIAWLQERSTRRKVNP